MTTTIRRTLAAGAASLMLIGLGACSDGDDSAADFCKKYRTFEDANERLAREQLRNLEDADLEDAKTVFARVADQLGELADSAPDEISESVAALSSKFSELNEEVQDAGDARELVDAARSASDDTSVDRQGDDVSDWVEDNCDSQGETKD